MLRSIRQRWRAADHFISQDLYGVAEPATPGDNLDVTVDTKASDVASSKTSDSVKTKIPGLMAATEATDGLSMGQKLFFVAVIVALCALFLRSRGGKSAGSGASKGKSMA